MQFGARNKQADKQQFKAWNIYEAVRYRTPGVRFRYTSRGSVRGNQFNSSAGLQWYAYRYLAGKVFETGF
jgi:hypothetical protein